MSHPKNTTVTAARDQVFWKRFSAAIHIDEEMNVDRQQSLGTEAGSSMTEKSQRPKLGHSESWLDRHRKKQQKAFVCGWIIVLVLIVMMAVIALACLWLSKLGPFTQAH